MVINRREATVGQRRRGRRRHFRAGAHASRGDLRERVAVAVRHDGAVGVGARNAGLHRRVVRRLIDVGREAGGVFGRTRFAPDFVACRIAVNTHVR